MVTYDFAILGDSQPEGLLAAAGLVRKGFSVIVVPSSAMAEMPPDDHWPLVLPSQMGNRKLHDLLFRAGFFRLEESGLMSMNHPVQVLLPKNRLLFEGGASEWLSEIEREFPYSLKTFSSLFQNSKKFSPQIIHRAASELFEIQKRDEHFKNWLKTEVHFRFRAIHSEISLEVLKEWLLFVLKQENKAYRVDSKIKVPYNQFLIEHAKKWGAVVSSEPLELKSAWTLFQLSKSVKASHLVINGMGGGRLIAKSLHPKLSERMRYWMFLDILRCPLSQVPEPLQEFSHLNLGDVVEGLPSARRLHLSVDRLRGTAELSLGSWLPFDDSKVWVRQIEAGRESLRTLIPFFPATAFKPIPSILELTEERGECVRRGECDRLIPEDPKISAVAKFLSGLKIRWRSKKKPTSLARRIYALNPHFLPQRNRLASFEESLSLLDYFEKKKRAQIAAG